MREIKFRAWNKTKEKSYFDTDIMEMQYVDSGYMTYFDILHVNVPEKDYILMQYTGLHDRNGKEIYEGDIISEAGAFVMWSDRLGCWAFNFQNDPTPEQPLFYEGIKTIKVIGNIYENPELLTSNI